MYYASGYISRYLGIERLGNPDFHSWWGDLDIVFSSDRFSHHRLYPENLVADISPIRV